MALISVPTGAQIPIDRYDPYKPIPADIQFRKAQEELRRGIAVEVETTGDFLTAAGITTDELLDAVETGANGAGWEVNQSSRWNISVAVTPLTSMDDENMFSVEVHAGDSELQLNGTDDLGGMGGVSAKSSVSVSKNDGIKLIAATKQLVSSVARKLRNLIYQHVHRIGSSLNGWD